MGQMAEQQTTPPPTTCCSHASEPGRRLSRSSREEWLWWGQQRAEGRAEPGAQASELIYKVNLQGVLLADRDQPGVLWAPHHPFAGLRLMEEIKGPTAGPLCSTVDRRPQRKAAVYSFI